MQINNRTRIKRDSKKQLQRTESCVEPWSPTSWTETIRTEWNTDTIRCTPLSFFYWYFHKTNLSPFVIEIYHFHADILNIQWQCSKSIIIWVPKLCYKDLGANRILTRTFCGYISIFNLFWLYVTLISLRRKTGCFPRYSESDLYLVMKGNWVYYGDTLEKSFPFYEMCKCYK